MDPISSKENDQNDVTTLYVGNLSLNTTDVDIYRLFTTIGGISSVKLVRPSNDQFYFKPTCYAYVSYRKKDDAEEAIRRLNFYELHGMQMRVMICDKNILKCGECNVIVKNLPEDIDDKTLYDTFSLFGKVISSKVACRNGKSLGYGYVQYADKKSAKKAIKLGTGTKMNQNILVVEKYEKKSSSTDDSFTNVYIKNFPSNIEEEQLRELLEKYGEILSFYMPRKENGEPKGFAFCNYKNCESAKNVVDELHNSNIFKLPEPFYIQRAQPRSEREIEIRSSLAKLSIEGKSFKRNLYVTNIPGNCSEQEVLELFSKYGQIISISVKPDSRSKQGTNFAYVCFSKPEEANSVMEDSGSITIDGNKLSISLFKCKRERELERENSNFTYQPGFVLQQKMSGIYDARVDQVHDLQAYNDLYKLVYSQASKYEDMWDIMGVTNSADFADKVTRLILKEYRAKSQSMIDLSSSLTEYNIYDVVRQYNENSGTSSGMFSKKNKK